jgi:hypothetical protein
MYSAYDKGGDQGVGCTSLGVVLSFSPYDRGLRGKGQRTAPRGLVLFLMISSGQFWRFLALFGGYWALFEAKSWGEVGRWLPTSDLYKPGLLEAMGGYSEKFMMNIFQAKAIFMQGSY